MPTLFPGLERTIADTKLSHASDVCFRVRRNRSGSGVCLVVVMMAEVLVSSGGGGGGVARR